MYFLSYKKKEKRKQETGNRKEEMGLRSKDHDEPNHLNHLNDPNEQKMFQEKN